MPRIDPYQLLKCLSVLLTSNGGIKTKNEVNRLVSLMSKFSKKLVSKCIYILILKSTETELLNMFMSAGGWDLTFGWLSDGIQAKNWPLVTELVELLLVCPVDIERLKGNNCPKVIKLLSKDMTSTESVRELAFRVVEQWLAIVKGACEVTSTTAAETPMEQDDIVENGVEDAHDEEMVEDIDTAQLPVYKITIRDGKQVLAEVISSDRTAPRVDNVKQSDEVPVCNLVSSDSESAGVSSSRTSKRLGDSVHTDKSVSGKGSSSQSSSDEDIVRPSSLNRRRLLSNKKESTKKKLPSNNDPDFVVSSKSIDKKKSLSEKKHKLDPKRDKSKDERTKIKDRSKPKSVVSDEQCERDRATLAKLITPSIGGLGKIPKKNRDEDDKDKKTERKPVEPAKLPPKDPKKYNISVEPRKGTQDRPKTVKTFNSKFRSTGLEEAAPLPKSFKKVEKKEEEEKKPVKRSSPNKEISSAPPEKKVKEEEKKSEKPSQPKSKIMFLQESDVFADALTAANPVKDVKKKKRRPSVTSSSTSNSEIKKEGSPTTVKHEDKKSQEPVKPVFKFYQDTLVTSEDKHVEDKENEEKEEETPKIKVEDKEEMEDNSEPCEMPENSNICPSSPVSKAELEDEVAKAEEAINQVLKMEERRNVEREKNRLPKGILVYVKKRKVDKKSVTWKPEKDLEATRYFELDETERVNVTKPFMDMKQMERISEREHILLSRKLPADDVMEEKTAWRPLTVIDIQGEQILSGKNSLEKEIQYARERTTLQAIYFNRRMIPDTPAEPDLEIHAVTEPVVIPLDDQTGNAESIISYKGKPWPEPKGFPPGVPPEVVGIESPPPGVIPQIPPQFPPGPQMMAGPFPPGPFPPGPFQPHPGAMPNPGHGPEWMGEGPPMMSGDMMMGNMGPPGMMGPPGGPGDMGFPMGPPHPPDFAMGPPPYPMGPPMPPGMFPPGPPFPPGPVGPDMRPPRPWFRQNGGPPGGTWRHPSKGGNWNKSRGVCNNFLKKGFCRMNGCPFRHPSGNSR